MCKSKFRNSGFDGELMGRADCGRRVRELFD